MVASETAGWSWNPHRPSSNMFSSLALECDKQHSHEPWQPYKNAQGQVVFPTKEEPAYPKLLCERVACILERCRLRTWFLVFLVIWNSSCIRRLKLQLVNCLQRNPGATGLNPRYLNMDTTPFFWQKPVTSNTLRSLSILCPKAPRYVIVFFFTWGCCVR